jgi:hypothetical protein
VCDIILSPQSYVNIGYMHRDKKNGGFIIKPPFLAM